MTDKEITAAMPVSALQQKQTNWNRIDYFLVFLVSFLPRLYYNMQMIPVRTISDEIATMSTGAYFAGLDWSAVVSNAGYYGGGFSILLTPVFFLTSNPVVIYRAALILAAVVQSLVAPISYHLMRKYFHVESRRYALIGSIACAFMVVTRSNIFYNEHMLILIVWLAAWLLCLLYSCREKKKKFVYSFLMILLLSYSLTVHIRSYVLWIALAIVVLCYYFAYKEWLMSKAVFVIGGLAGVLLSNQFISFIQAQIWQTGEGETIRNSAIEVTTSANLLDPVVWKSWLNIIFGQIYTIGLYSGAILIIALAVFLPTIVCVLFVKKRRQQVENRLYFIIPFMFMLCIGITIAGQSISWLSDATAAMEGEDDYGLKAFTYIRYFGPYCGPVFMAALVYLKDHFKGSRKVIWGSFGTLMALQLYWLLAIVPNIAGHSISGEIFTSFVNKTFGSYRDVYMYVLPMVFLIVFFVLLVLLYSRKNAAVAAVTFLTVFLVWEYDRGSYLYDINESNNRLDTISASCELADEIEANGMSLPDTIYVVDSSDATDHNTYYLYQFYFNRCTVIPDYPEEGCEEAIVFCNEHNNAELMQRGFEEYQLDSNEWVYVSGERIENLIESVL